MKYYNDEYYTNILFVFVSVVSLMRVLRVVHMLEEFQGVRKIQGSAYMILYSYITYI